MRATYEVGELPERADEERRKAPLLERFGVPVVELVDEVGVRRRELEYICCGYCEFIGAGEGEGALGKTPELVVRVLEWPNCDSMPDGGLAATPGFAMGLRRRGRAPYGLLGWGGWAMTDCIAIGDPSLGDLRG